MEGGEKVRCKSVIKMRLVLSITSVTSKHIVYGYQEGLQKL